MNDDKANEIIQLLCERIWGFGGILFLDALFLALVGEEYNDEHVLPLIWDETCDMISGEGDYAEGEEDPKASADLLVSLWEDYLSKSSPDPDIEGNIQIIKSWYPDGCRKLA